MIGPDQTPTGSSPFLPPEWPEWNIWGRIAYVVTLVALLYGAWVGANWMADALFGP